MKLAFKIAGAGFSDGGEHHEIARILDKAAAEFINYNEEFKLSDINGNQVGAARLTGDVPVPPGRAISVEMSTGNAAFAESYAGWEVGRILREAATKVREGGFDGELNLRDINGNKVGQLLEHNLPLPENAVNAQNQQRDNDSSFEP